MRQGPYSLNSSRSTSPGLVAFSSSAFTRANAFLPPSCQASSPHSVRTTVPSGFVTGLPGEILLPTSTTRFAFGRLLTPASASTASTPGSSLGRRAGEQVIEREHRVRLAAAEVRLELHDRVAALAGEAPDTADEQALQALGEERAAEELLRFPVLVRALAEVHLPQIGRELRLLVAAARHVGVRRHHLAPGLERARGRRLDQRAAGLALLAAHLLVEDEPAQLETAGNCGPCLGNSTPAASTARCAGSD